LKPIPWYGNLFRCCRRFLVVGFNEVGEIETKWIYDVFDPIEVHVQLDQFVQLDGLDVDGVFEIRELGFAHRVS
jgi:hypothetical protein